MNTTIALLAEAVVLTALFAVVFRHLGRQQDSHHATLDRLALAGTDIANRLIQTLEAERADRQMLLQRIQAPQAAVIQHQIDTAGDAPDPYPNTDKQTADLHDLSLVEMVAAIEHAEAEQAAVVEAAA